MDALRLRLQEVPAGIMSPLHPELMPRLVTVLQGRIEITSSIGECCRLMPGCIMLFLDTHGEGHSFVTAPEKNNFDDRTPIR